MIAKLSYLRLSGRIFVRAHLSSYISSVSGANCIQTNPKDDQHPPNSSEYEASVQSLKTNLHPDTLIHVLSSTNDLNSSLRLFKWASLQNRFRHTTDTYYHIIMRLGMACRVDEVEGFCIEMVKARFPESEQALLRLLDSFISYHRLDEALRVLFVLNSFSFKPSIALINRLLGTLAEEKKGLKSVLFVYKEMVKASIFPSIETLNHLLEALFDADRVDAVLDQYNRMQKKGCDPNSRTYEIMVSGLIEKNLIDDALVILNQILENGCDLESKFFSHIIPLLFKTNKHEIGLRLFKKMKTFNILPDLSTYQVLIHYFSKNLSMDDAINLLHEMINHELKPLDCVILDLINGFCALNKFSDAKTFLEDYQVREANSYNPLLNGYCKSGNFLEVIQLFQEMVEKNITNSLSWNICIRFLSENQRSNTVYKVLSRMIVSGFTPDSITYSALIIEKCNSNEIDQALNFFHLVREEHDALDSSSYATLIESLCQNDKILESIDVFRYMSFKKSMLPGSTFSILIMGLCRIGKVNKAIDLIPLAYYSGLSFSNSNYNIIMKGLSKITKKNYLMVVFARMVVEGCCLDSEGYTELIKSTIEHSQVTECCLFLDKMVDEGFQPAKEILADLVSFLGQNCCLHLVLDSIYKLVCDCDCEVVDPEICGMLINGLWKEGYKDEGRWLLDLMLEKGWVPDGGTHRLLINSGGCDVFEKGNTQDEISNILSEGFGE